MRRSIRRFGRRFEPGSRERDRGGLADELRLPPGEEEGPSRTRGDSAHPVRSRGCVSWRRRFGPGTERIGNFNGGRGVQGVGAAVKVEDLELVDRTLAGEPRAFEELVLRYQDRLYNAVVHTVGCAEEARDIVQEAFLSAYTKLSSFQRNASFYTWLFRIGFNASISFRRKRRPALAVDPQRDENGVEPIDRHESPESPLHREERIGQVRTALGRLSEEHRAILVLRELEGFDYEKIGEMLDLPVGTVRSRLHRARSQLKETLEQMREGHPID